MKQLLRNIKIAIVFLLVLTLALGGGLLYQQHQSQTTLKAVVGENVASLRERYAQAGTIFSKDGMELAYSKEGERLYAEDLDLQLSLTQLVGDYTHRIVNTIETQYQDEILGTKRGITEQLLLDIAGRGSQGSNVYLTIQSHLNRYAYQQLQEIGLNGTVVLMNYETGEIVSMVSTPTTPVQNIVDWSDLPDSSLFNRALQGEYAPASTFKILTSAAWMQAPNFNPAFTVDDTNSPFRPNGATDSVDPYGVLDLDKAFAVSSNAFFGETAVQMGEKYYSEFLKALPLHQIQNVDRLTLAPVLYDSSAAANGDDALLSWFGTGQPVGNLRISETPVHLALITAAVANGGNFPQPKIIDKILNPLNKEVSTKSKTDAYRMFSPQIATRLSQLMIQGVESEFSVQYNARIPGVKIGGKSGTLERGSGENYTKNALWTGFVADRTTPFCIAVVCEGADFSNTSAVIVGRNILEQAIHYGVR